MKPFLILQKKDNMYILIGTLLLWSFGSTVTLAPLTPMSHFINSKSQSIVCLFPDPQISCHLEKFEDGKVVLIGLRLS